MSSVKLTTLSQMRTAMERIQKLTASIVTTISDAIDEVDAKVDSIPIDDVMTGATASAAGKQGLVPAPSAGSNGSYLRGDGTWDDLSSVLGGDITEADIDAIVS